MWKEPDDYRVKKWTLLRESGSVLFSQEEVKFWEAGMEDEYRDAFGKLLREGKDSLGKKQLGILESGRITKIIKAVEVDCPVGSEVWQDGMAQIVCYRKNIGASDEYVECYWVGEKDWPVLVSGELLDALCLSAHTEDKSLALSAHLPWKMEVFSEGGLADPLKNRFEARRVD